MVSAQRWGPLGGLQAVAVAVGRCLALIGILSPNEHVCYVLLAWANSVRQCLERYFRREAT